MATEAAEREHPRVFDARAALAATLAELDSRSIAEFRTLHAPVAEAQRLAEELGDQEAAQRAALLQADVLLREGRIAEGGAGPASISARWHTGTRSPACTTVGTSTSGCRS